MHAPRWRLKFELKPGYWVYVPTNEQSLIGEDIQRRINKSWRIPRYYFHLKSGGHLACLRYHLNSTYFARLDIKNFFGSISKSRITRALKEIIGYDDARDIAKISTVPCSNSQPFSHCLPYGFVQSPILASICLHKSYLGMVLSRLQTQDIKISVYMDDIVLSGQALDALNSVFDTVKTAARKAGFELNSIKEIQPQPSMCCFNIDIKHDQLVVSDHRLQSFIKCFNESNSKMVRQGIVSYISSVNQDQANQFLSLVTP
jgi:hypothetical protein